MINFDEWRSILLRQEHLLVIQNLKCLLLTETLQVPGTEKGGVGLSLGIDGKVSNSTIYARPIQEKPNIKSFADSFLVLSVNLPIKLLIISPRLHHVVTLLFLMKKSGNQDHH
jgi:hypothetical protein